MTPNTGNNTGQRKGLLASARGTKEPKRPPKYRRGGVSNSGASLQPARPDPNAGRQQRDDAKFLGQMQELIFGKGMVHEQLRESEREKGIASFEKANAKQREDFRDAISDGWIDSKESPYFREGVTISHTKNLLTTTSLDLYTEYEKWEGKNDPSSGAFDKWLEEQDQKSAINLENIPDSILADHFYEPHQAIKRQLAQQHAGYLNKEYRDKANVAADLRFGGLVKQYAESMGIDLGSDPDIKIKDILRYQGISEHEARRVGRLLKTVPVTGDNIGIMPKESLRELELMAVNLGGVAENTLFNYNGTDAETLRIENDYELTWEQSKVGLEIKRIAQEVTPEADANTIGEFALGLVGSTASQKRLFLEANIENQTEEFSNIIVSTIPEGAMDNKEGSSLTRGWINRTDSVLVPIKNTDTSLLIKESQSILSETPIKSPPIEITDTRVGTIKANQMKKGGHSGDLAKTLLEQGMKEGVYKDWFVKLNKTVDPDIILAISNDFFDKYHEGLLKKGKTIYERTMKTFRVGSKYKNTEIDQGDFVAFTENHPLFAPYKKSTKS